MHQAPLNVFICYAREDRPSLNQLMGHLAVFERNDTVRFWYDKEITGGKDWDEEIRVNLKSADIVLLLISPDFFQSDYIHSVELTEALQRDRDKEALVVPVILKKCLWGKHRELARLQALPAEAKPVYDRAHWPDPDDDFYDVAEGFDRILEDPETETRSQRKAARKKREAEEAARREAESEEQRRREEEAARKKREEETAARKKREAEEAARREAEAEEQRRQEDEAARRKLEPEMVFIEGGAFTMGWLNKERDGDGYNDEKPVHEVRVKDFFIGKYPVTQKQWRAVMGSDPPELVFEGCDDCPVECVSWNDIQEFLKKLNAMTAPTGKSGYRLPTEAEWEYAARGGNKRKGYLYSGSNNLDEVAWYDGNSGWKTHPVGQKKLNELGLYDMSGNVWEWCEDDWHSNYEGAPTDGRAWADRPRGGDRVLRGGSWSDDARDCRVADRVIGSPTLRSLSHGFRLALQF